MAINENSSFPKAPALLKSHHQFIVKNMSLVGREAYPSAEMQSEYSTALADWAKGNRIHTFHKDISSKWNANSIAFPQAITVTQYTPLLICASSFISIIIMSCRLHGYHWPSLATSPYRLSHLAGLKGYIPYGHIAVECMFELVVLLLSGHMWGSIGVHHLWARPCFSSIVLHVWFV